MSRPQLLPEGWCWVRFGDVVRQVKDRVDPEGAGIERYVAGEHMDTDDLRIRRWGTVGDGYLGPAFHMRFRPRHVLYGSRRTYLRKVAVADFEGICANTTFVLEPSTDELLPEFLPLVMTTDAFHNHSIDQSKGSVNPYINFRDLTWYEFALPPLEVQAQATYALDTVYSVTESYDVVDAAVARHRDALLAGRWTERAPHTPLGDLASITVGIVVKPASLYVSTNDGVTALRSLNVLPGHVDEADAVRISPSAHASHRKSQLMGGDVVVVRSGAPGVAAVIPRDNVPRNAIDLLIVRCGPELNPHFLVGYLNSAAGRAELLGRSGGTAQKHLNAGQLQHARIPTPTLGVQARLVEVLAASSKVAVATANARARLTEAQSALREQLVSVEPPKVVRHV